MNAPAIEHQPDSPLASPTAPPVYTQTGAVYAQIGPRDNVVPGRKKTKPKKSKILNQRSWKRRFLQKLASPPAMFVLATIIAPGLLIGARQGLVESILATAKLYAAVGLPVNLDGLDLRDVSSVLKTGPDGRHLLIKGEIVNLRRKTGNLPNLQLALRGKDGRYLYNWQAPSPQKRIKPGDSIRFVARLDTPPEGAKDVLVQFARQGG